MRKGIPPFPVYVLQKIVDDPKLSGLVAKGALGGGLMSEGGLIEISGSASIFTIRTDLGTTYPATSGPQTG